jgi:hypothetical protein
MEEVSPRSDGNPLILKCLPSRLTAAIIEGSKVSNLFLQTSNIVNYWEKLVVMGLILRI